MRKKEISDTEIKSVIESRKVRYYIICMIFSPHKESELLQVLNDT